MFGLLALYSFFAIVLASFLVFMPKGNDEALPPVLPADYVTSVIPTHTPRYANDSGDDDIEWFVFHLESQRDAVSEFNALFNSYETKWSKNGRLMIRQGDNGSFKFVKKG